MTIFDLMQSQEITAYWETLTQDEPPYIGEELFPVQKKRGLNLQWIKGSKGLPAVLKTSAFDAFAIPRPRIGFSKLESQMPYFKESMYIDEELRQELNMVLETGNQAYIDSVMNRIFDDEMDLLRGARVARERMRMMLLSTGVISMQNNGQVFSYDFGIPSENKMNAATAWSDTANADPITDLVTAKEYINAQTGETVTRGIISLKNWNQIKHNEAIVKSIYVMGGGAGYVTDAQLNAYLLETTGIRFAINDKRFKDETGASQRFYPEDQLSLFPDGNLGSTWYGTTPAESDLMSGSAANVSITDTGVAVVTAQKVDPVQVETIVSQICLPSFERADSVAIIDVNP